jgi:hypothetical protein
VKPPTVCAPLHKEQPNGLAQDVPLRVHILDFPAWRILESWGPWLVLGVFINVTFRKGAISHVESCFSCRLRHSRYGEPPWTAPQAREEGPGCCRTYTCKNTAYNTTFGIVFCGTPVVKIYGLADELNSRNLERVYRRSSYWNRASVHYLDIHSVARVGVLTSGRNVCIAEVQACEQPLMESAGHLMTTIVQRLNMHICIR